MTKPDKRAWDFKSTEEYAEALIEGRIIDTSRGKYPYSPLPELKKGASMTFEELGPAFLKAKERKE